MALTLAFILVWHCSRGFSIFGSEIFEYNSSEFPIVQSPSTTGSNSVSNLEFQNISNNISPEDLELTTEKESMLDSAEKVISSAAENFGRLWHSVDFWTKEITLDNIHFYLYTRQNPDFPENLTVNVKFLQEHGIPVKLDDSATNEIMSTTVINEVTSTPKIIKVRRDKLEDINKLNAIHGVEQSKYFDIQFSTKIIIHGYTQSYDDELLKRIKNEYLKRGFFNIIMVDWSELAVGPCYWRAVKNTKAVGFYLGLYLHQLLLTGGKLDLIHIIGFSLGAQIAGFINSEHYRVNRITGLDPALPFFKEKGYLKSGDAKFVDVIHTETEYLGQPISVGDADFYPNGGKKQPGCKNIDWACSHRRALIYFAESVSSKKGFIAIKCSSWEDFEMNNCNISSASETELMGDTCSTMASGIFYLRTGDQHPFALKWWIDQ